jgi:hypothetical protein
MAGAKVDVISSGVVTLIGFTGLLLAFLAVSSRHGSAAALVSLSWVPLVALILGFAAQQSLGYAFLSLLIAIMVSSVALALLGVVLTIRTLQRGSGPIRALASGTMVAAAPFVVLVGAWIFQAIMER